MQPAVKPGARVVVTGATGNVGTSVVRALSDDPAVASIVGVARRQPDWSSPKLEWATVDLGQDATDVGQWLRGADVVIHLAWMLQPAREPATTWRTNVLGSIHLFEAIARVGVPAVVYASSVGAYSPGPKDRRVTEDWPTHGWPEASYTREKAYLERYLDGYEPRHPGVRVVRMRPAFMFQRASASEQQRLFGGLAGRLLGSRIARPGLVPFVPDIPGLVMQGLHTADAADAFRRAALRDVRGPFNLAADPVLDTAALSALLGARRVPVPRWAAHGAVAAAWQLHAVPVPPGLLEAALRLPLMDDTRARTELGWAPRYTATEAVGELLQGLREGAGTSTPPLTPQRNHERPRQDAR